MKLDFQPLAAVVLLSSIALLPGAAWSQPAAVSSVPPAHGTPAQPAPPNAAPVQAGPLADGAEIFENLTESAPTIDAAAFQKALAQFQALQPAISQRLPAERQQRLDTLVSGLRSAWQKGDRAGMAVQSIEAYRLLEESIDHSAQAVPLQVYLLDYAGFKLDALLLTTPPDWKQITQTAHEAAGWWAAIGPRITDKTLQGAMAQTVNGLQEAAAKKNPELLHFAAQMDLTLVDGLEAFFGSHPRGG